MDLFQGFEDEILFSIRLILDCYGIFSVIMCVCMFLFVSCQILECCFLFLLFLMLLLLKKVDERSFIDVDHEKHFSCKNAVIKLLND